MNNSRYLTIILITLLLFACMSGRQKADLKDNALTPEKSRSSLRQVIEPKKAMSGSEELIRRTLKLGPKLPEVPETRLKEMSRSFVAKEEQPNYIEVDTEEDLFPVTVNILDVDIRMFARMLSAITGINIVVGDEVEGVVNVRLNNTPWDKMLDTVLKIKGLAKYVDADANIIRIHKREALLATEDFDRKRAQDLSKTRDLKKAVEPLYTEIFRLFYTDPEQVKKEIEDVFAMGGKGGSTDKKVNITIDPRLNSLIVKGRKGDLDLIGNIINKVDVRTKQVLIEAFIIEATDTFKKELGTRLGYDLNKPNKLGYNKIQLGGIAGTADTADDSQSLVIGDDSGALTSGLNVAAPNFGMGLLLRTPITQLKLELTALEEMGLSKTMANPRVFTLDNEEASIFQGTQFYVTVLVDGTPTNQAESAGLSLKVTPHIVDDGNIILTLVITNDTVDTAQDPPVKTERKIETKLLVQDKHTVVIGGIYTNSESDGKKKVPGLGDIPLIGRAFRKDTRNDEHKELLVFISPHVI